MKHKSYRELSKTIDFAKAYGYKSTFPTDYSTYAATSSTSAGNEGSKERYFKFKVKKAEEPRYDEANDDFVLVKHKPKPKVRRKNRNAYVCLNKVNPSYILKGLRTGKMIFPLKSTVLVNGEIWNGAPEGFRFVGYLMEHREVFAFTEGGTSKYLTLKNIPPHQFHAKRGPFYDIITLLAEIKKLAFEIKMF